MNQHELTLPEQLQRLEVLARFWQNECDSNMFMPSTTRTLTDMDGTP